MDEQVLNMIDTLVNEIFDLEWCLGSDKDALKKLLESRFIWVINYTHSVDAIL
jgi:hypothetical protein